MDPADDAGVDPMRVSANCLVIYYLGATLAELCISPVGLSSMSKLAPCARLRLTSRRPVPHHLAPSRLADPRCTDWG